MNGGRDERTKRRRSALIRERQTDEGSEVRRTTSEPELMPILAALWVDVKWVFERNEGS